MHDYSKWADLCSEMFFMEIYPVDEMLCIDIQNEISKKIKLDNKIVCDI